MLLLAGGRVVMPGGVLSPGWIRLDRSVIDAVGSGGVPDQPAVDLRGQWVLPGFMDLHVHGGGGASFTEGTIDEARQAAAFHHARGTTSMLASLVTAPLADLETRAALLADLAEDGVVAGLHLEGPFLSPARRGAQDLRHMLPPDVAVFERLHAAARGHLRVITLAPELPGALEVVKAATQAGVTVAVGHTDATADVTLAAIDAGATHATHLFNGMRPFHHREPGAVGALLDRDEVTCEIIADGVHLHDIAIRLAARAAGPGRLVLVSDAMAAAGMPDGRYQLGSKRVTVTGGVARLQEDPGQPGAIAGSTATLADVVRHAIAAGLPVPNVAAAASTTPARVLGLGDHTGALRPGLAADLVVCDGDFRLRAVMRQGEWLAASLSLYAPDRHQLDGPVQQRLAAQPGGDVAGFADDRLGGLGIQVLGVVEQAMGQVIRRAPRTQAAEPQRGSGIGAKPIAIPPGRAALRTRHHETFIPRPGTPSYVTAACLRRR